MARKKQLTQGEIIVANIKYYKSTSGLEDEPIYTAARMCRTTWHNRLNHPETFSIGELLNVARKFDIPLISLITPKEA